MARHAENGLKKGGCVYFERRELKAIKIALKFQRDMSISHGIAYLKTETDSATKAALRRVREALNTLKGD